MESLICLSSSNISLASNNHVLMRASKYKIKKSMHNHMVYNWQSSSSTVGINHDARKLSHVINSFALTSRPYHGLELPHMEANRAGSSVLCQSGKDFVNIVEMHRDQGIGIVEFLRGKTLLVTGATGFFAKVLIEKILRTAPDVHRIFVLIKAKDKATTVERLKNEIIGAELFKLLKQIHGKSYQAFMLSKLVPVVGSICESNLGMDEDTANSIAKEVDIIINSAANTTFDERYDTALDVNTGGPMRIMSFVKQCHKLKLFLHVSTAYVNGQRQGKIMEKHFFLGQSIQHESKRQAYMSPSKFNVEDEIKLALESKQALGSNNSLLRKMKKLGIQRANTFGWQDTYVFTKAMGEMMIDNLRGDIPVAVIRPSIIESSYKEPFPGWIEGNRMMDPIIVLYGKGYITGFLVDPNVAIDLVPVDMVVNATLAAIAKHGAVGKQENNYNIYQVASSVVNPLVCGDLWKYIYEHFNSFPFIDSKGSLVHVSPVKFFSSLDDLSTDLQRHAMNQTGRLGGATTKLSRKLVEQAKYLANIYEPYIFYSGRFDNSNTKGLMGCMSKEEREEFGFDVESIDWEDYIMNIHIPGLRRHVMKH